MEILKVYGHICPVVNFSKRFFGANFEYLFSCLAETAKISHFKFNKWFRSILVDINDIVFIFLQVVASEEFVILLILGQSKKKFHNIDHSNISGGCKI